MSTDADLGIALLTVARNAIGARFDLPARPVAALAALEAPGASFVTLTEDGALRGCIGSLEAYRCLRQDVAHNALAAAFNDPRFPPLAPGEFARVRVEVSRLAPAAALEAHDEAQVLARLRPGVDGVILEFHGRRATFLPQVWDSLPEPRRFLAQLKDKAGLAPDFWHPDLRVMTYRVDKWREATTPCPA